MRRSINLRPALPLIALAGLVFVVPQIAHAQFIDIATSAIGRFFIWPVEILILPLSSFFMYLAGMIMDTSIQFGLHTAYIFSLSPAINLGWVIIRDIANIFFIFILIWISLGTIVNGTRFGTMNMLKNVVIAALLINFSLFFTKTLVDVSNVFGNWLYGGIQKTLVVNSQDQNKPTSLSGLIATRLGVMQFWLGNAKENANGVGKNPADLTDPSKGFIAGILRLTVVSIATYIFMYCAVLFIARSVTILFLMVFSPIGFMGSVLPQISEYSKKWWKELSSAAIFPVAFLLMLYISLQFINSLQDLSLEMLQDKAIDSMGISVSQYFQYFLIIFLLKATLNIAKKNSGEMGTALGGLASSLGKLAVGAVGTYATGGLMMGLRAGGRGLGAALTAEKGQGWDAFKKTGKENLAPWMTDPKVMKYVKDPRKALKDAGEATTNKMKSGTWDVRNIGIGDNKVGNLMTNIVGGATGDKGIDLKGKDAKAIKADTAEWAEERKIEKANQAILKQIESVLEVMAGPGHYNTKALKVGLDQAESAWKANPTAASEAAYRTAQTQYMTALQGYNSNNAVKDAKAKIAEEAQKLGNKQLEKLDKKATKNEQFVQVISQSQAEHLADKAENDEDKAKIWGARLADVSGAVKNRASAEEVKKAIKSHSDKELENLTPDTLIEESFVNPHVMDYDKFDKLMKSSRLTGTTKKKMKDARYKKLDDAISLGNVAVIRDELKELEENEIAKLGWRDPGGPDKRLSHSEVIYRLTPKTLGKVLDELGSAERTEIKTRIQNAPATLPPDVRENVDKVIEWFRDNPVGKTF
ncbi:MAG: hypothetical protein HZA81_04320 [Candidatus Taylorbacteria bacterium]|nr:hypothetical protein [Candidatus Taylorbacteria bacterium]